MLFSDRKWDCSFCENSVQFRSFSWRSIACIELALTKTEWGTSLICIDRYDYHQPAQTHTHTHTQPPARFKSTGIASASECVLPPLFSSASYLLEIVLNNFFSNFSIFNFSIVHFPFANKHAPHVVYQTKGWINCKLSFALSSPDSSSNSYQLTKKQCKSFKPITVSVVKWRFFFLINAKKEIRERKSWIINRNILDENSIESVN